MINVVENDSRFMKMLADTWSGLIVEAGRNGVSGDELKDSTRWVVRAVKTVSPSIGDLDAERIATRLISRGLVPVPE